MDGITMTEDELRSLREELGELETSGRSEMAARIKTAREWGDLKENAEYHAAKEAQAHLETRILRLREQLRAAVVVDAPAGASGGVRHGSTVTITDLGSERTREVKIVSPNDARPAQGMLSSTSPVAQALLGHGAGDVVKVETPGGVRELRVDSIA
ncbi:MAG TPA: transcription elongation factor GreA [Solirubrobacteraceae bacterium]|nr:transcription elongation factor GreA [Solirubrobacteraceae bacterium]